MTFNVEKRHQHFGMFVVQDITPQIWYHIWYDIRVLHSFAVMFVLRPLLSEIYAGTYSRLVKTGSKHGYMRLKIKNDQLYN